MECYHCGGKFVVEQMYMDASPSTDSAAPDEGMEEEATPSASARRPSGTGERRETASRPRKKPRSQTSQRKPAVSPSYRPAAKKKGGSTVTLAVMALVILLAGGGGIAFFLSKKSKKPAVTPLPPPEEIVSDATTARPELPTTTPNSSTDSVPSPEKNASIPFTWKKCSVSVDASKIVFKRDIHRLLGTNVALWYARYFQTGHLDKVVDAWRPGVIRMPGGSWSDALYWNGNGAAKGGFDKKTGLWRIDYSKFSPGFLVEGKGRRKSRPIRKGRHDVRVLHDFIKRHQGYAEALVTVNGGTGDARMAAEWVRWANKKWKYGVRYWQVGNELDGGWECGHYMWPDNREMAAEDYARKFAEYADAMKKVDPGIKVGAQVDPAWVEALLRHCPDKVDFIDHHFYYRDRRNLRDGWLGSFMDLERSEKAFEVDRKLLAKYAPGRKIELGITEWNVHSKGPETIEIGCGLFSCYAVGRMMEMGLDFANQWDLCTSGGKCSEGHGLIDFVGKSKVVLKPQYWAMCLWSAHMSDTMVESRAAGDKKFFAFATMEPGVKLSVMLININPSDSLVADLRVSGFPVGTVAKETLFSNANYFWNPGDGKLMWSSKPRVSYSSRSSFPVTLVPPYSVKVLEIPATGSSMESEFAAAAKSWRPRIPASLEILLPENSPPVASLDGFVVVRDKSGRVATGPMPPAKLKVSGLASLEKNVISLDSGVGRFKLLPPNLSGHVSVTATSGALSAKKTIEMRAPKYIDIPLLNFESFEDLKRVSQKLGKFTLDPRQRPNQRVLSDNLTGSSIGKRRKDLLFYINFNQIQRVPRGRIGGVFFDIALSGDFSEDSVKIHVALGGAKWSFILTKGAKGSFTHKRFLVSGSKEHEAARNTNSCHFIIETKNPIKGSIFLDDFGLIEYK